ncbi:LysM peptidoglycan-binding domain-containing protein [Planctomyces sp. SH-PL62]|uniref:LysM peptidoglycan-binding domain-containing protein n=1 Tax=Planctomyces sp. SH-PL62 TaxID=1636152 RepID=UPI00078C1BA2|nr:LysM peptidoglycan-binding domain-containing protein [Planctomyces sp. SH-PL62]AMV40342.1 LysM domain/BON superfamily protein [Planctomyces sp. SH-PL62]
MVEPGTYPDPDEPQALTPDAVAYPPDAFESDGAPTATDHEAHVHQAIDDGSEGPTGAIADAVAVDDAEASPEADGPSAPGAAAKLLGAVGTVGAACWRGASAAAVGGLGLAWAYPRASAASGLSVLVLLGVLSLKSGKSPTLDLPGPEAPPAATTKGDPVVPPADDPETIAATPPEAEDDATPAPAPSPAAAPEAVADLPAPAPATDDLKRTSGRDDMDFPALPPMNDHEPDFPVAADLDDAPAPNASLMLASAGFKPEDDLPAPAPAPAPAPEPEHQDAAPAPAPAPAPVAEPTAEAEPAPAPAPAAETAPAPAPPTEPAPSPPVNLAPTPPETAPVQPEIAPAQPVTATPTPEPTTPTPEPEPLPAPTPPSTTPAAGLGSFDLPPMVDAAAAPPPVEPAATPAVDVAPIDKPAASVPAPVPVPVPLPSPAVSAPAAPTEVPPLRTIPDPTPLAEPKRGANAGDRATERPPGDWVPIRHSPGEPQIDPGVMDLTDDEFDMRTGRPTADLLGERRPFEPEEPIRFVSEAGRTTAPAPTAAATTASAAVAARRDEGRMDTVLHKVQPGENFWTISRTHYASGRYYRALGKANSDQFQRLEDLYVGAVIRIPPPEDLDTAFIDPPGGRSARDQDPAAPEISQVKTALPGGATSVRRSSRHDGELNLPVSDPSTERVADRDDRDRRRTSPREDLEAPAIATRNAAPQPVHKVRARETLRSIARDRLGDSRRAPEILDLNRDVIDDPVHLVVGQLLYLPDDAE